MKHKILCFVFVVLSGIDIICGTENRIVGGQDAKEGEFPYQVSLRKKDRHFCGGSILDEKWILTAAHCVRGQNHEHVKVVVGSVLLDAGGDHYDIKRFIQHSEYSPENLNSDIALVELNDQFKFHHGVEALKLPEEDILADKEVVLSGWGTTSYPGHTPNKLQTIKFLTITNERCQAAHKKSQIYDSMICTFTKAGEGACHGDSGGPLVYNGMQVGVVSWGYPCAKGKPDVFTRVYKFLDWIKENKKAKEDNSR